MNNMINSNAVSGEKHLMNFMEWDPMFAHSLNKCEVYTKHSPYQYNNMVKEANEHPLDSSYAFQGALLRIYHGYTYKTIERILTKGWYAYHWYDTANDSFEHYAHERLIRRKGQSFGLALQNKNQKKPYIIVDMGASAEKITRIGSYPNIEWANYKMNVERIRELRKHKRVLTNAGYSPIERQLILNAIYNAVEDGFVPSPVFKENAIDDIIRTLAEKKWNELYFYQKNNPNYMRKIKIDESLVIECNWMNRTGKVGLIEPDWETIMQY